MTVLEPGRSNLIKEIVLPQVPNCRYVFNQVENEFTLIDTSPVSVTIDNPTLETGPIKGTIDGSPTGVEYTFVNNVKNQILATHDRVQEIVYEDFGTKNQRIKEINYTSNLFPGVIAKKILTYVLESGRYKRTNIIWSIE
jgi:DNA-binding beta-propeller fold protein YncE